MLTLSDSELLRIARLSAEEATNVLPALRQTLVLLPNTPIHVPDDAQWPLFATAVVGAISKAASLLDDEGFINAGRPATVVTQITGILRERMARHEGIKWAFNRASVRHWLDVDYDDFSNARRYRASVLGERTVRDALLGAIEEVRPAAAEVSSLDRLKAFRTALLAYVSDARRSMQEREMLDAGLFTAMQDAWIELADVLHPKENYQVDDIEEAVTTMIPEYPHDVWSRAEWQIGRLILTIGCESRLQKARADAFRSDIDKLFPSAKPPVVAEPPNSTPEPSTVSAASPDREIQYVTRDDAAALCRKSKATVERWFKEDIIAPDPVVEGGGGRAHLYDYALLRPWLEQQSGMRLPKRFPNYK